jgi:ribosomal 30S subunit maturation factor RimM
VVVSVAPNEPTRGREVHVEQLVGRHICDVEGRKIGRIEELVVELAGTDWLVVEAHVGPGALLERIVDLSSLLPLMSALTKRLNTRYSVRWKDLDLSDVDHPRAFVRRSDLKRLSD